jgi:hypothetical protein
LLKAKNSCILPSLCYCWRDSRVNRLCEYLTRAPQLSSYLFATQNLTMPRHDYFRCKRLDTFQRVEPDAPLFQVARFQVW